MTTFVAFQPAPGRGFSFNATLDGTSYQLAVTWNVFGQRWYLTCAGSDGTLIFHLPLIGSPNTGDINLAAGYFTTSAVVFRQDTQNFEVSP